MHGLRHGSPRRAAASRRLLATAIAIAAVALLALLLLRKDGAALSEESDATARSVSAKAGSESQGQQQVADAPSFPKDANGASIARAEEAAVGHAAASREPMDIFVGRVVAADGGAPVAGARVSLARVLESRRFEMALPPTFLASATTDVDGAYRLEFPASRFAGNVISALAVEAEGFAQEIASSPEWIPPTVREVDFELEPGGRVAGWVIDTDGNPVGDALVGSPILTLPERPDRRPPGGRFMYTHFGWATTGGNGGFELFSLPVGTMLVLPARADGYMPGISGDVEAGEKDVRIVLSRGGAAIVGEVLHADGMPCAGAIVDCTGEEPGSGKNVGEMQRFVAGIRGATADAAGRFRIGNLAEGPWRLTAVDPSTRGSEASSVSQDVVLEKDGEATVTLRFESPAILVGRAIDVDTRQGIAGVRISDEMFAVLDARGGWRDPVQEGRNEVATARDGSFRIEVPMSSDRRGVEIHFEAPDGYMPEAKDGSSSRNRYVMREAKGGEESQVELRFVRGAVISGRVLDSDGATPVADAAVRSTAERPGRGNSGFERTDASGNFHMTVDPSTRVTLTARCEAGTGEATVDVPAEGAPPPVEIVLAACGSISGTVAAVGGAPLRQVVVNATPRSYQWNGSKSAKTDANGKYLIDGVSPGDVRITLELPDDCKLAPPEGLDVKLAAGETRKGVDFVLGEGDFLEGVVSGGSGRPIKGAEVSAQSHGSSSNARRSAFTDAEGYYRIAGIREDSIVGTLRATHPGHVEKERRSVSPLDGPQNFVLQRAGTATLVVLDEASGEPVARYEYLLGSAGSYRTRSVRVSDPRGRAAISLPVGRSERVNVAEIGDDRMPTGRKGSASFTMEGDGEEQTVVVKIGGAGHEVSGLVTMKETGEPVEGALVGVFEDTYSARVAALSAFDVQSVRTDAHGIFAFKGLLEGTYQITATKEGLATTDLIAVRIPPQEDAEKIVIDMSVGGTVFGTVTGRDGKPVADGSVEWSESRAPRRGTVSTDKGGMYRITGLNARDSNIAFQDKATGARDSRTVIPVAGGETEVNFDFSGTVRLSGSIVANGKPWNGTAPYLSFRERTGPRISSIASKGSGAYESFLHPGDWKLRVVGDTGAAGVAARFATPAEPREQTMDFVVATVPVDVVIETPEGTPFIPGYLNMSQAVDGAEEDVGMFVQIQTPRKHLTAIVPGRVKISFKADAHPLSGESDWIDIAPGAENFVAIFASVPNGGATKAKSGPAENAE